MKLPIHILKSINANETSIGNNPALPPDDENKFLMKLIKTEFEELTKDINNNDDIRQDLSLLLTQCQKNESNNIPSLEELCINTINKIIQIPEDTIDIEAKIVNKIEVKQQRMMPEQTDDFSFDSIDDINYLTDEIYKRRFLNALVNGASLVYANNVELYLSELYKINPELPSIYNKIMKYNTILLYTEKDYERWRQNSRDSWHRPRRTRNQGKRLQRSQDSAVQLSEGEHKRMHCRGLFAAGPQSRTGS